MNTTSTRLPALKTRCNGLLILAGSTRDLHRGVNVPPIFKDPPRVLQKKTFPFCTLLVDRDFLKRIVLDPGWNRTILQAEVGPPLSDDAARSFAENLPTAT